nr:MAG TPA: baseplate wedge protein [Caudoviricetes sp.]
MEQLASHHHPVPANSADYITAGAGGQAYYVLLSGSGVKTSPTGGSQPHTHTLSGASGASDSLPPYYALALIMRIA